MSSSQAASSAPVTPVRQRFSAPRTPSSTVSTPYTAISSTCRSVPSSTLTTPSPIKVSPNSSRQAKPSKSAADLTENWRVRARLNGIKVSATEDGDAKKGKDSPFHRLITLTQIATMLNPLASPVSPGFSPVFRRKSPSLLTPVSASRRYSSVFNTPSKVTHGKYTLGAFTSPSRTRTLYDSPFSDFGKDEETNGEPKPALPSLRVFQDLSNLNSTVQSSPRTSCSVCDKEPSGLSRMIVLSPCSHIFCASCFTGTLNIVGEKSMSCMECHSPVNNFHFALTDVSNSEIASHPTTLLGNPFKEFAPTSSGLKTVSSKRSGRQTMAVIRIDNVPWDVTPLAIKKFIKHPILHAHVLLDVKGKTLSHAFVELTPENARAALRTSQNAILGDGRRARAVTVTLSSQAELMAALYPHWRGSFDGYQPSLDGLDNQQVNEALQHGLISEAELMSLFNLITTPDSHFLKVPSLPFYSLISILSTFPVDVDSRVFWSCQLRDALFRVTHTALEILAPQKMSEEDVDLWDQLVTLSIGCRAFTASQIFKLQLLIQNHLIAESNLPVETLSSNLHPQTSEKFNNLAEQFRLEPGVLAAILQSFA